MAATPSTMLPLGTPLPTFQLTNAVDGQIVDSTAATANAQGTLVMFICNHCPYVLHIRGRLIEIAKDAASRGIAVLPINSNSLRTHPQDGPDAMRKLAKEEHWPFPFLFDDTQDVAKAFHAACTPDFYLFDKNRKLVYRGQFDDSRPSNGKPVTGVDLQAAIQAVLDQTMPSPQQKASIGCNIKWHPA